MIFRDKRGLSAENVMFTPRNFLFEEEHGVYDKQVAQMPHSELLQLSEITQMNELKDEFPSLHISFVYWMNKSLICPL